MEQTHFQPTEHRSQSIYQTDRSLFTSPTITISVVKAQKLKNLHLLPPNMSFIVTELNRAIQTTHCHHHNHSFPNGATLAIMQSQSITTKAASCALHLSI